MSLAALRHEQEKGVRTFWRFNGHVEGYRIFAGVVLILALHEESFWRAETRLMRELFMGGR